MKRYAVLFAPEFRLQAALRHAPRSKGMPCALVETEGRASRVTELNRPALTAGVEHGMSPSQALARCENLQPRFG